MIAPPSAATLILLALLSLSSLAWLNDRVDLGVPGVLFVLTWLSATLDDQRSKRQRRLALTALQDLSPRELELHVAQVLNSLPGWRAEATREGGDQGADVIATGPNRQRLAIQVKHYRNNVGNDAVQQVVASKAYYRCTGAVVFTSGPGYTGAAQTLATANTVKLWGPRDLLQLQQAAQTRTAPATALLPPAPKTSWWT
jgi:HJR/Mrr/RecB family endonuclease